MLIYHRNFLGKFEKAHNDNKQQKEPIAPKEYQMPASISRHKKMKAGATKKNSSFLIHLPFSEMMRLIQNPCFPHYYRQVAFGPLSKADLFQFYGLLLDTA